MAFAMLQSIRDVDWSPLEQQLGGRLIKISSPLEELATSQASRAASDGFFAKIQNPYLLGDNPALTQTFGWAGAWTTHASDYAVVAASAEDVASAIDFARKNGLRLVVKGGGHSYFGNSNAPNSLLLWTRRMNAVELHNAFVPKGAPRDISSVPAVSIGPGAIWGSVYHKVAVEHGRYVQGGGCLTVGVSGFTLGGGFGSLSKNFGTGASNLLEAEVVTADGRIRTVNDWNEPDLFFALRGGGGGSFGVVTRLTMLTHQLPETIGAVLFEVEAHSDEAWRSMVARIIDFYATTLFNPIWGEQIRFSPGRKVSVAMLFHGLDESSARAVWQPFFGWLAERSNDYSMKREPIFLAVSGRQFWDPAFLRSMPDIVLTDDRPDAPASNIYWATNRSEAGQVIQAYESCWLPAALLQAAERPKLVDALVEAAAEWSIALHVNKGLAGGSEEALARTRRTATNPSVLNSFALIICASEGSPAWPGIAGHEPDLADARQAAASVSKAMVPIYRIAPGSGAYLSETNYFTRDWKHAYWGDNYRRLAAVKRRYDPDGLFRVHHGVEPV
jgi:FAD/FMN-containing dehydrogenase